jgi:hypothetical protein
MKKTWIDQPISEIAEQLTMDIELGLSLEEASKRSANGSTASP